MSISVREARSIIRKAIRRVPEGEDIHHLNIMPMMDMMTILLVFLIKQAATGASPMALKDVEPPNSLTRTPTEEQTTQVTIARTGILVDGIPTVAVNDGTVDASDRRGGALGMEIIPLTDVLRLHRAAFKDTAAAIGETPTEPDKITIIADKNIPYKLLFSVMYTARQSCQGESDCYRTFSLLVRNPLTDAALEKLQREAEEKAAAEGG